MVSGNPSLIALSHVPSEVDNPPIDEFKIPDKQKTSHWSGSNIDSSMLKIWKSMYDKGVDLKDEAIDQLKQAGMI